MSEGSAPIRFYIRRGSVFIFMLDNLEIIGLNK